jgi:hypothetical protein
MHWHKSVPSMNWVSAAATNTFINRQRDKSRLLDSRHYRYKNRMHQRRMIDQAAAYGNLSLISSPRGVQNRSIEGKLAPDAYGGTPS